MFQSAFIPAGTGISPRSVAIGDLNADGKPDLAVANYSSSTVSVSLNLGASSSAPGLLAPGDGSAVSALPQFSWQGIAGAAAYEVVVATNALLTTPVWVSQVAAPTSSVAYAGAPLTLGATYFWSVRALVGGQWTPRAAPRWFSRGTATSTAGMPVLLAPADMATVPLPETFSWNPAAGATAYRVRIASSATMATPLWVSGITNSNSLVVPSGIPGMVLGQTYYWTAAGIDAAGAEGPQAAARSLLLAATSPLPGQAILDSPANGSTVASRVVSFGWQPALRATRYELTYSTLPSFAQGSNTTWTLRDLTQTVASVTLPAGSATIYWMVVGLNAAGRGPESLVRSFAYSVSGGPLVGALVVTPSAGTVVSRNASFSATARILGSTAQPVQGTWRVDGADWQTFSFVPIDPNRIVVSSPPLPTGVTGSHSVQCVVTSPSSVSSVPQAYVVVDRQPGPPARISVVVLPSGLPADGVSPATASVSVLDSTGLLVSTDSGRSVITVISGPASVSPTTGTTTSGLWTTTITAGTSGGTAVLGITASGLAPASVLIHVTATQLAMLKAVAGEYLDQLESLSVPGPFGLGTLGLIPGAYQVGAARSFVASASEADTAAILRLMLASRTLLDLYHHEATCQAPCADEAVPGAFALADEAAANLLSFSGPITGMMGLIGRWQLLHQSCQGLGCLSLARQIDRQTAKLLMGALAKQLDAVLPDVLNRVPNDWTRKNRQVITQGYSAMLKTLEAAIEQNLRSGPGDLFAGVFVPQLRAPLTTIVLGTHYVQAATQGQLTRAVSLAQGPITRTAAQAWNHSNINVSGVRITSASYMDAAETFRRRGDGFGLAASVANLFGSTGLGVLVSVAANLWASVFYAHGTVAAFDGYQQIAPFAQSAVSGIFGASQSAVPVGATGAPSATGSTQKFAPSRAVWEELLETQGVTTQGFEAIARALANVVQQGDTASTQALVLELLNSADSLGTSTDLAQSPLGSAAEEALFSLSEFDSVSVAVQLAAGAATGARLQLVAAVLSYLGDPGNALARQSVVDAADVAINRNKEATSAIEQAVTSLFTTPAVPYVRLLSATMPDSVGAGQSFTIRTVWSNLGAGVADSAFASIVRDSMVTVSGADSVALPQLAPGATCEVVWTVSALPNAPADSTRQRIQLVRLLSGCSNGIGAVRTAALTVSTYLTTGVEAGPIQSSGLQLSIWPNPATATAGVRFILPTAGRVAVEVFDISGRRIATIGAGEFGAGSHALIWSGDREGGGKATAGIYRVRLRTAYGSKSANLVWVPR